jgi:hypothetical protein
MRKRTVKYLLVGVAGYLILSVFVSQIVLWRMAPSLSREYRQITEEVYERYLNDGALPPPSTLSASARRTLSADVGITYSVTDGLSYRYEKPYRVRPSVWGFLTFGLYRGDTTARVGESISPEDIIHNAKLRAGGL